MTLHKNLKATTEKLNAPAAVKAVSHRGLGEVIVASCDKDGPFVAPALLGRGIYEIEKAVWVCQEAKTE